MADLQKIVDDLSSLTLLEAAELTKMLEEKWGVSAPRQWPARGHARGRPAHRRGRRGADRVQRHFMEVGPKKINVIMKVRALTNLGLKEGRSMVRRAPSWKP